MNNLSELSFGEWFWLGSLVVLILGCLVWAAQSRDPRAWMQPPLVMAVIFFYYGVASPLKILRNGEWFDRTVNLRSSMGISWAGACIALLAFLVGYGLSRPKLQPPRFGSGVQPFQAKRWGLRLNIFALSFFGLSQGARLIAFLNPVGVANADVEFTGYDLGALANYAELSINLLIPGCLLLTAAWIRRQDSPIPLILWVLASAAIFTSIGFRWRLAVLMASILLLWFLARRVRPNLMIVVPTVFAMLLMAGFVGMTREYGNGLDLYYVQGKGLIDILLESFSEGSIFLTSGAVMALTPSHIPYAGFTPIFNTLLHPLPRALFPWKNSGQYLADATAVVYGDDMLNTGSAITNYAEYFLMGGWPVVIIISLLLGYLCRRLWLWFKLRGDDPMAQVTYVSNVAFLYVVVSRGYMPQVVMMWCFTAAPLFLLYRLSIRNQLRIFRATMIPRSTHHLLPPHLRHQRP